MRWVSVVNSVAKRGEAWHAISCHFHHRLTRELYACTLGGQTDPTPGGEGWTMLTWSYAQRANMVYKVLIAREGIDLDARAGPEGTTVLVMAANRGDVYVLLFFVFWTRVGGRVGGARDMASCRWCHAWLAPYYASCRWRRAVFIALPFFFVSPTAPPFPSP